MIRLLEVAARMGRLSLFVWHCIVVACYLLIAAWLVAGILMPGYHPAPGAANWFVWWAARP